MRARPYLSILTAVFALMLALPATLEADDEEGFKPIFDGQSLDGWRPHGEDASYWRVEDGAIVGESTEDHPLDHNTFLVWDHGQVDDFELRLQFRITGSDQANSGIQFRGVQREDGHVIGYQADIDRAGNWVGCLYDEAQRGTLATRGQNVTVDENGERAIEQTGDAAELLSHVDINDWNDYSISARGNVITLSLNGHQTLQVTDNDPNGLDLSGLLALQLHSGPPMKIEFRNIRLKRFPLEDGRAKIVFVAGSASHGYYEHEHNAGCLLLAAHLNEAAREHGLPVTTAVYNNGWPKDPTALDNADCVVSYCDGGGGHYLNDRLDHFDWFVENKHVGLVCIHYAVEVPAGPSGEHFLKWIGGYFEPHWSVNPHWDASFDELPEHPITNGVEPFTINDEWYYHMRFPEAMEGVTPILTDLPPRETLSREDGPHSGNPHVREAVLQRMEPQHVGWAFERPDGTGRGFGFTGGHFHRNWQDGNFRKLVLNAICWAAQLDVPEDGVTTHTPSQEEMDGNQDEQPPGNAGIQVPAESVPVAFDDEGNARPVYSGDVVTTATPGHVVDIEADIRGADKLFLVVTDGRNGFSCDWADWAEPQLVQQVAERRVRVVNGLDEEYDAINEVLISLTDLDWAAASSEWGQVRKNSNAEGRPLQIDGLAVENGIGTHANSIIEFDLPEGHGFTHFRARGGLDNGGTDQAGGGGTSVQFHVFTERPSRRWLARMTSGGSNAPASHESTDAIAQLAVHPDLEATLFAAEPMMLNPTDIDIDHLGRVWVCEVVNYRRFANSDHPERTEGDRILILEDTDHDGVADESTVFYQGRDVDSAHGICVLPTIDGKGTRAIISCGDSVFFLIDDDGDLQADRKELLFTGIDGTQHDHGIHALVFGPDGKLYFNFGNAGRHISDKDGNPIVDRAGNAVNDSRQPYQEGMVFRCNMDGSEFETLGWNFRNNWEVAVDSFGTMWQSDNDDDGNRGVRINYVMEFGNFGYRDELTGAGWNEPRTGWEEEIPLRHWHQNDPGVVPNLLQTGAGSPTGICVYEGSLLPTVFQGQVIHTDAGPNICRAYPVEVSGAGYTAESIDILNGAENQWFRPSDVCVAPDGSLIVADWYDPGVGGHRMQDVIHGRLFRVTPADSDTTTNYVAAELDLLSAEGAVEALKSPNMATRYLAWNALYAMGADAVPALEAVFHGDEHPRFRARALWLLGKLVQQDADTLAEVIEGLQDDDADIRVTAIRLARQLIHEGAATFEQLEGHVPFDDPSPAVRRELAIGIRDLRDTLPAADCAEAWAALARQYDGEDRWYLEALGIAADGHWDEYLTKYLESAGDGWQANGAARDIVWRSRAAATPQLLASIVINDLGPAEEIPRYFRAFDFLPQSENKRGSLSALALIDVTRDAARATFIKSEALSRLQGVNVASNAELAAALGTVLDASRGTPQFVDFVNRFEVADRYPELLALAQEQPDQQLGVDALRVLLDRGQLDLIAGGLSGDNPQTVERIFTAIATAGDGRTVDLLRAILNDSSQDVANRRNAIRALGSARQGAEGLLALAQSENYDPALKDALAATLTSVEWDDLKGPALAMFPLPETQSMEPIPPLAELIERSGDVANGRLLFHSTATCHKCHQVNGIGQIIGPDLSEIGRKLTRQAMYESVLFPSAGISHSFETWAVATIDGDIVTGLLMSETDEAIEIKNEKGVTTTIAIDDIEERRKLDVSLMPADLMKLMSVSDLVDIVEYMTTLQQKQEPLESQ